MQQIQSTSNSGAKLKDEIEEQNKRLQTVANNLVPENLDFRKRIQRTEQARATQERVNPLDSIDRIG